MLIQTVKTLVENVTVLPAYKLPFPAHVNAGWWDFVLPGSYGGWWCTPAALGWQQSHTEASNTCIHSFEWTIKSFWKWEEAQIWRKTQTRLLQFWTEEAFQMKGSQEQEPVQLTCLSWTCSTSDMQTEGPHVCESTCDRLGWEFRLLLGCVGLQQSLGCYLVM